MLRRLLVGTLLLPALLYAELVGPRIARLEEDLAAGQVKALDQFWEEVEASKMPLIEPSDEEGFSLVTFVYRANGGVKRIVLWGIEPVDPEERLMIKMTGTNLWYRTCKIANDVRTTYHFSVNGTLTPFSKVPLDDFLEELIEEKELWRPDPFNPPKKKHASYYSKLMMPDAPDQRWTRKYADVKRGAVAAHKFESEILGNKRKLRIYVPPGYKDSGEPYPLVILFDGKQYDSVIPAPVILDNLISTEQIPPVVALLIGNASPTSRNEELTCNPDFAQFVVEELLPWTHEHYNVTGDRAKVVVGGASFGGLAASYLALNYPEHFGNVLSQSGAFFWRPRGDEQSAWILAQFQVQEPLPLRFFLDVGTLEQYPWFGGPSILEVNRQMRDLLQEKGYPVAYVEFAGGHDSICWKGTLADGLIALLGGI